MGISSVVIDSREPEWLRSLTFGGSPVIVDTLHAGDLWLMCSDGALLVVERKEAGDFLNTLRDGRLFPQLAKLRELTPWAYLAIVGYLQPGPSGLAVVDGHQTAWNWASCQGALLTAQEMGVSVLYISHGADYEQAILRLSNRDRTALRVAPARDATLVTDAETVLASLPGVGPERARAVLAHCGTTAWALAFLSDDERQNDAVPGIGAGVKRKVRQALGLGPGTSLWLWDRERDEPCEGPAAKQKELTPF